MAPALLLFLAAQAVEPPRTVNDEVFGKAEDFMTRGPARVCIRDTSVDIEAGETAYLDYVGIHWGSVRVAGPRGTFVVADHESLLRPGRRTVWETDRRGRTMARRHDDGALTYLIFATNSRADAKPRVRVTGDALGRSTARDEAILERILANDRPPTGCARRFDYGWDLLLGEPE
jgi:hypothetical protein